MKWRIVSMVDDIEDEKLLQAIYMAILAIKKAAS